MLKIQECGFGEPDVGDFEYTFVFFPMQTYAETANTHRRQIYTPLT